MSDEPQPEISQPVPKPRKPRKPKPTPEPEPKPPRKRKRRKPNPVQIGQWDVDWYAVGLGILALFTFLPYIAPLLKDGEKTKPDTVIIENLSGNVSTWLGLVASDDVASDRPKFVEALRATASAEIPEASKIDDVLKTEVESRMGRVGYANWGLFSIEIIKEIRKLRDSGKLDGSVKKHQNVLSQIADALEKAVL